MIRLRALRLAEVGRFTSPVAVQGFGDGLNVLSGANEHGKSTLLSALDAALRYAYKQSNEDLRKLRPNTGGAPLIEIDFEAEGRLWRLRKQFLSGASSALLDVKSGTLLKNADAEARLEAIKKASLDFDRFGLLWVRQGDFSAPADTSGGIGAFVAREVEAVSLDPFARAIHARIRKELLELQTEKTAKAKGAWLAAVLSAQTTAARLASADECAAKQTERLENLEKLTAERAALLKPDAATTRADALTEARSRHGAALEALRQRGEAAKTLADALAVVQATERDDKALREAIGLLDRLTQQRQTAADKSAELRHRHNAVTEDLAQAHAAETQNGQAVGALEAELTAAHNAVRAQTATIERDKLADRIAQVRAAIADQQRAANDVAALSSVSEASVKALHVAAADLARLDAALAAVVPDVSIALETTAAGRIVVGGKPLMENATFNPDTPLTIEITGIGRITIAPNPATVSPAQRAARERWHAEIETWYALLGVATTAEADVRLAAKKGADAAAREAAIRINALAPQGLDALIAAHAEYALRAATAVAQFDPSAVATLEGRHAQLLHAHRASSALVIAAQQALHALALEMAKHEADAENCAKQIAELELKLGDLDARQAWSAALTAKLATAREAYMAAKSAADAWAASPEADRVEVMEAEVRVAERTVKSAEERRIALEQFIFGLESELRVASDEDIDTELESARAAAATATARLADITGEVDALRLLDREFKAIADAGRNELSGPILKRIQPYLARIFSNATLELADKLAPARLLRDGRIEAHEQLSRGTQEQIAILVRLGLARLLAERGAAVPLILDDALVYADDRRIAAMFEALQDAARLHQVILLTCREQTFASLAHAPDGKILAFEPWAPTALAA